MKEYRVVRQAVVMQELLVNAVDEDDALYRAESIGDEWWTTLEDSSAEIAGTLTSEEVQE